MELKVIWSDRAARDLSEICGYISDNPDAAEKLAMRILNHTELLATAPDHGPLFRGARSTNVRSILEGNYRIYYRVHASEGIVRILHVRHCARQRPTSRDFE